MALLLDLAYNKEYFNFCNLFYNPLYNNFNPNLIYNNNSISVDILNNMVFIVDDKELFINSIKEKVIMLMKDLNNEEDILIIWVTLLVI